MNSLTTHHPYNGSPDATDASLAHHVSTFRQMFERCTDAIFLFDPRREIFVDCNQAAVEMMGATSKQQLLMMHPADLSPEFQPDGRSSREKTSEVINIVFSNGSHRFEWRARRIEGTEFFLEVLLIAIQTGEHPLMAVICLDITERKRSERELLELTQTLERRVTERTAELSASEARFRALVENAPESIVVYSVDTGRFLFGNQHACDLYGVPMSRLPELTPTDVSPEFQPCGRRTSDLLREKTREVMEGGISAFEWVHKHASGRLIPTDVRLLRLPAEGQNLVRASIIDNTERKNAERALRESEAKFRALFEGASQGVVLHDEHQLLEVNPAAVRILGRRSASELVGKHPGEFSPTLQPNGENSLALAGKHIEQCMTTGSARFDWLACHPNGQEILLEVMLTRIEWSGRQVIQAFITDITERNRAQTALAESEARFSAAFHASPALLGILRVSDGKYVLANDAHLNWLGYRREEVLGRTCLELGMWENPCERDLLLNDVGVSGSVRQRECCWRNRRGERFTFLLSVETIKLNETPHLLVMALDITQRKRVEEELRASEARLRESEARFSVAFQASPVFISILKMSDGSYVLANDAFVNWVGLPREKVIGCSSAEFGMWERVEARDSALEAMRTVGSIRNRECRWRNLRDETVTVLLSAETIQLDNTPHILSFALDITQRKRADEELRASETRLRESEARFSAAFHSSPIITGITRASDGRFVLINDASVKWSGYSREEILGRTAVELDIWDAPAERERFVADVRRSSSVRARECRLRNRHGNVSTMLASGAIIEIDGVDHLLVMMVEITQRKQAEAELHRTLAREKELSQLKSNFVSMVSHEFRTPLGIIQSSAELLRDFHQKMQPPERQEQLDSISRNTRRMAGMMEEVLVLSRLDAGRLEFQPAPLDLNSFCRRIVDEVLSATGRRCFIELSLNSIPTEAQADERLLGHIFTNLLSNAVKYSEPGATVHFAVERDSADAVCIVRDQGIGISEQDQQQLFKAFHRGSNVGTRPGTGLGLLLVKRCADLHGGKVQVNSTVGKGTTVTVKFPVF